LKQILANQGLLTLAARQARDELERLQRLGGCLLCPESPEYPQALKNIPDPPAVLNCRGDLSLLSRPTIALIGSRAATEYGRRIASQFATELARRHIVVVSGAAYGIDAAAHRGALAAKGKTVAVLGCGLDVAYPKSHASMLDEIAADGLLVSEYPLGTKPEGFRFPARNRLISGLCQGVVVVEATEKSGSLITARLALDQGREVFAVPGRVDSPKSSGSHWLIRQGAQLVRDAGDVLEELGWGQVATASDVRLDQEAEDSVLTEKERLLWGVLEAYPQDIDTLVRRTGLCVVEVHGVLLQLELRGVIRHLPGQLYERSDER
jgi:DNA processing protein